MFDVFYFGDNPQLVDEIPFATKISSYNDIRTLTSMYWVVMPDTEILDFEVFDFRPAKHDQCYTHIWKWTNISYGGVMLCPNSDTAGYKKINYRASKPDFSIVDTSPDEYFDNNPHSDFVWVVDLDYTLSTSPWWAPDFFDDEYVYQFCLPDQTDYQYGGITLYPRKWKSLSFKYLSELKPDVDYDIKSYPVAYLSIDDDLIEQLKKADSACDTSMFWAVDPFVKVEDSFTFDYQPAPWDQGFVHVFQDYTGKHRAIRLYPKGTFVNDELTAAQVVNNTFPNLKLIDMVATQPSTWPVVQLDNLTRDNLIQVLDNSSEPFVWTVDPDVSVCHETIQAGYVPTPLTAHKVSVWQRINPATNTVHSYGGLRLWPTNIDQELITTDTVMYNRIKTINYVRAPGCEYKPYDIVFISNNEPSASKNLRILRDKNLINEVLWVNGVSGIFNAHKEAAALASSKMLWVVDGDAEVLDSFDFSYIPDQYDQEVVHVWHSVNPVTGAEYGYGGVKLFNRAQILQLHTWGLDFTTGVSNRFKVMTETSCVSRFNSDAFSAWRSAFRECVKLLIADTVESRRHFDTWRNINYDVDYAENVQQGVNDAIIYVNKYKNKIEKIALINNFEWLREVYDSFRNMA